MVKNRCFLKIFGREKIFFLKNVLVLSSKNFNRGSFELSYSCVLLTFAEIFPSEQISTTTLLLYHQIMSEIKYFFHICSATGARWFYIRSWPKIERPEILFSEARNIFWNICDQNSIDFYP